MACLNKLIEKVFHGSERLGQLTSGKYESGIFEY